MPGCDACIPHGGMQRGIVSFAVRRVTNACLSATVCFLFVASLSGQTVSDDNIRFRYGEAKKGMDTAACPAHTTDISEDSLVVAFFTAANYYPELCGVNIRLRYGAVKTSMAARPSVGSMFRKRSKRTYFLIVNRRAKSPQAQLLHEIPFNASVGLMGHELAHVLDYSNRSGWQILCIGIRYLGKNYRRRMERQTDATAISKGLGQPLYDYARYVIHRSAVGEKYRRYKLTYYMTPEEIRNALNNTE
ncbi:MAG: hypothetical protein LBS03_01655 [Bacteroidales bacterium]|jgi:hypothetical protein|nr:hypothetical protein [Bacteroidales bacterium]